MSDERKAAEIRQTIDQWEKTLAEARSAAAMVKVAEDVLRTLRAALAVAEGVEPAPSDPKPTEGEFSKIKLIKAILIVLGKRPKGYLMDIKEELIPALLAGGAQTGAVPSLFRPMHQHNAWKSVTTALRENPGKTVYSILNKKEKIGTVRLP
jgi:hypothetical protein